MNLVAENWPDIFEKIPAKWLLENESLKIKVEPDARKILEKLDKLEQVIS